MNMQYLDPETISLIEKRYPGVYHIMLAAALRNERAALEQELESFGTEYPFYPGRKRWIESRLADLKAFD